MNIDLYGPEGNDPQAVTRRDLRRVVVAAQITLEKDFEKSLAFAKTIDEVETMGEALEILEGTTIDARLALQAWTAADRLHTWLDSLPQEDRCPT